MVWTRTALRSVGTLAGLIAGIITSTIAASQELVLAFPLK
jgi:hypothetical protein